MCDDSIERHNGQLTEFLVVQNLVDLGLTQVRVQGPKVADRFKWVSVLEETSSGNNVCENPL